MRQIEEKNMEWVRWKKEEQYRATRMKFAAEKKRMNMTMREKNGERQAWTKQQHDRVVSHSNYKNKKRDYLNLLKRIEQKT